jgi:anti-sigma B factor antagonist
MHVTHTTRDQISVISLSGNLIGEKDGMPLMELVSEQIDQNVINFVIDLSELKLINSTGLGALITLLTRVRRRGGDLFLANPSSYINNLLLITKLNTIFHIHPSVDDAAGAFAAQN